MAANSPTSKVLSSTQDELPDKGQAEEALPMHRTKHPVDARPGKWHLFYDKTWGHVPAGQVSNSQTSLINHVLRPLSHGPE